MYMVDRPSGESENAVSRFNKVTKKGKSSSGPWLIEQTFLRHEQKGRVLKGAQEEGNSQE